MSHFQNTKHGSVRAYKCEWLVGLPFITYHHSFPWQTREVWRWHLSRIHPQPVNWPAWLWLGSKLSRSGLSSPVWLWQNLDAQIISNNHLNFSMSLSPSSWVNYFGRCNWVIFYEATIIEILVLSLRWPYMLFGSLWWNMYLKNQVLVPKR